MLKHLFPKRAPRKDGAKKHHEHWIAPLLTFLVASFAIVIFVGAVLFYRAPDASPDIRTIAQMLRLPVAIVGRQVVTAHALAEQRDALAIFAKAQIAQSPNTFQTPTSEQFDQIVVDRLIRNSVVDIVARKNHISVTDSEVRADFISKVGTADMTEISKQLQKEFGLTVDEYLTLIVRPFLLTEKLNSIVAEDVTAKTDLETRANVLRAALAETPAIPFADLVGKYSDDKDAAANGGDLGYKKKGELPDAVFTAAVALEAGKRSDLILAEDGYHVIELVESVPPTEDGTPVIHAREILIRRLTVDAWLTQQTQKTRVNVFLPWLRWDANLAQVMEAKA